MPAFPKDSVAEIFPPDVLVGAAVLSGQALDLFTSF